MPYGYWDADGGHLGASPELLFADDGVEIQTMAVAGTARAGRAPDEMMDDPKERSEHALVLDDLTAQMGPLGSVTRGATRLWRIGILSHLRTDLRVTPAQTPAFADLVRLLHPTPAVGMLRGETGAGGCNGWTEWIAGLSLRLSAWPCPTAPPAASWRSAVCSGTGSPPAAGPAAGWSRAVTSGARRTSFASNLPLPEAIWDFEHGANQLRTVRGNSPRAARGGRAHDLSLSRRTKCPPRAGLRGGAGFLQSGFVFEERSAAFLHSGGKRATGDRLR